MALSIFDDKSKFPDDKDLTDVLSENHILWNNIKDFVFQNYPDAKEEWNYSGKNYGWGFRLKDKKRVIVYLTPCAGFFKFAMVYGEKATNDALTGNISKEIKDIIDSAKVYAEGRGFRIDVKNDKFIEDIKKLIIIKLAN